MRILLDDTETNLNASTISDGLRQAATLAETRGRMIVEVEVDGIRWSEDDLTTSEGSSRAAGELKLLSANPAELVRDTFSECARAVAGLDELQRDCAKLLQASRTKEGLDGLLEALAVWGAVQTGLSRGLGLGVLSAEDVAARGIDFDGAVKALDARLRSLRDAMASQDITALCDCLNYEFPPVVKTFVELLDALSQEAAAAAGTSRARG
jgi:hypothetical protein